MTYKCKSADFIRAHTDYKSDECLSWPYGRDSQGYARACVRGYSTRLAHRIMCEMVWGPPPNPDSVARHLCGKGHEGCINPMHLKWGTVAENAADQEIHGTKLFGEKKGRAVLCPQRVRKIRAMSLGGMAQRKIATQIGVSAGTVQAILEGRTWGHVK